MKTVLFDIFTFVQENPKSIGEMENKGIKKFPPPTTGEGNDWLLILDQLGTGYDEPGKWKK